MGNVNKLGFSIVIVTWNGLHHLKEFLPSVNSTDYPDFEIIIADNNSTDGTVEWLEHEYPWVKIARYNKNYGYCGGNNRSIPYAVKDIIVFLNNDVKVDPNWLTHLATSFDYENVVAAQPKMRSLKEPEFFEYAGAAGGFLDKLGYPFCRGRIMDKLEKDEGQYDLQENIFWASGAALAIRRDAFINIGGFDEDFEFHMEEIDLCWRLLNQGRKIVYQPESVVYHLGGGSLPMGSPRKVYYNFRNSLVMLWKNWTLKSLLIKFPIRLILDVIAAYRALLSGKPKEWWAIARAHLYFFRHFPSIAKKRMYTKWDRRVEGEPEEFSSKHLIYNFFLKGKKTYTEIER